MDFWVTFWSVFFFASVALFTLLAVVVSIAGFFNIRAMFKAFRDQDTQDRQT